MKNTMPQEIEVWYLIPALRREIAKSLIKRHNLSQRKVADLLGVTEAAVSHYLSSKRGAGLVFPKNYTKEIAKASNRIVKDNGNAIKHLYDLCKIFKKPSIICYIHRKYDKNIKRGCNICFSKN